MTLRRIPREFAALNDYPDGPKAGSPSKIRPVAIAAGGIRPGSGGKPGAEEMNDLLNHATLHLRNARYTFLETWQNLGTYSHSVRDAKDSKSGFTYLALNNAQYGLCHATSSAGSTLNDAQTAADDFTSIVRTNQYLYLFGKLTAGTKSGRRLDMHAQDSGDDVTWAGSATGRWLGAWDSVNGKIACLGSGAPNAVLGHLDDDGTAAATTHTATGALQADAAIVSGSGVSLAVSLITGGFLARKSTDGGVTWAVSAAPGVDGDRLCGLAYAPNFLGLGPRFVAHVRLAAGTHRVLTADTTLGSWTTHIGSLGSLGGVDSDTEIAKSFLLGDTLVTFAIDTPGNLKERAITITDLGDAEVIRIGFGYESDGQIATAADAPAAGVPQVAWSGTRFYAKTEAGNLIRSAPYGLRPQVTNAAREFFQ